ncbi:thioredoxin domain-containing protein [Winogradskyella aurantiaca]|uniref:thioredoxin domain-containing protein n=1 Tax=Winogradskyella aurantiaca TaxID=2219558 RepID=UPI000E1DF83C|nr:thioredoxin domain-containing protein [Winogradskyella aurantiaca]
MNALKSFSSIAISAFTLLLIVACGSSNKDKEVEVSQIPNDLINETSPYLLQHAYNPVNWKPWAESTLKQAVDENKLIVISIGYSSCHWCHVMEEESFENDSVASLMNEKFVSIKVDREERPDVDQVYMSAVQLMTGGGGWPLNVVALPDGRPVFGGTYFSKNQWLKALEELSVLYDRDPSKMVAFAENLMEGVNSLALVSPNKETSLITASEIKDITDLLENSLDQDNGGLKGAPKFPMPTLLSYLLRYSYQFNDVELREFVVRTLDLMKNGGIYDQLGGGFARYSVDENWHIPHFEKMLYDNALLIQTYSEAYQLTGKESYKEVVRETLAFVEKELTNDIGAFYSSLDADSRDTEDSKIEGAFYTWNETELENLLKSDTDLFKEYFNLNESTKWEEDRFVLFKSIPDNEFAAKFDLTESELKKLIQKWKDKLLPHRNLRNRPNLDDKILSSWNAMMLKAYISAYKAFGESHYLDMALQNANFIMVNQVLDNGQMYHVYKDGEKSINGFLEDYAFTIDAFLSLYEVTLDPKWLDTSKMLVDYAIIHFSNENGLFYFTSSLDKELIVRKTETFDNVIPSSNSVMAQNLLKLGHYYANRDFLDRSSKMLSIISSEFKNSPSSYANWLNHSLNFSNPFYEIAVSGEDSKAIIIELNEAYLPNKIISGSTVESDLPLLKNKFVENSTYIYVCVNGTCKLPVEEVSLAIEQIKK